MIRRILVYSAGAVALVALFWMIGGDLIELLRNVSPAWLLLTAVCWISAFAIRGARWKILLSPIGSDVSFSSSFWSISMSYLVNFILPTKWGSEVVRAFALSKKEKISFLPTFSSIAVEKVLDLLTMVTLASGALVFLPTIIPVPLWVFYVLKILAVLAVALLVALLAVSWKLKHLIDKTNAQANVFGRIRRKLITTISALASGAGWVLKYPVPFLRSLGLTFILWFVFSAGVYGVFQSFGIAPEPLAILLGTLLISFAYVLPNVPGYVGTYEGIWVLIFLGLGLGTSQIVFAGAVVGHLVSTAITVSLGSIGLMKVGMSLAESLRIRSWHDQAAMSTKKGKDLA